MLEGFARFLVSIFVYFVMLRKIFEIFRKDILAILRDVCRKTQAKASFVLLLCYWDK